MCSLGTEMVSFDIDWHQFLSKREDSDSAGRHKTNRDYQNTDSQNLHKFNNKYIVLMACLDLDQHILLSMVNQRFPAFPSPFQSSRRVAVVSISLYDDHFFQFVDLNHLMISALELIEQPSITFCLFRISRVYFSLTS